MSDTDEYSSHRHISLSGQILVILIVSTLALLLMYSAFAIFMVVFREMSLVHFTTRFLQVVVPCLTPLLGAAALYATFRSLEQRIDADERDRYYSQLRWAIDKVEDAEGDKQAVMVGLLGAVVQSRRVSEDEQYFVEQVGDYIRQAQAEWGLEDPTALSDNEDGSLHENENVDQGQVTAEGHYSPEGLFTRGPTDFRFDPNQQS